MSAIELSLLVLSEDSGAQAAPALAALLKKMLRLVDDACGTHRIEFLPADEASRTALRGKRHAGNDNEAQSHRQLLAGKIADQIAKAEPEGFVAYHADADRRWSDRSPSDFPDFARLRDAVISRLGAPRRGGTPVEPNRIERVFLLGAYYEVESWLYQNTAEATRICVERDRGAHVDLFQRWALDRAALDEVEDVKDVCCLHGDYNKRLAEAPFPAQAVDDAGTSFHSSVERLRASPPLTEALERTRRP